MNPKYHFKLNWDKKRVIKLEEIKLYSGVVLVGLSLESHNLENNTESLKLVPLTRLFESEAGKIIRDSGGFLSYNPSLTLSR